MEMHKLSLEDVARWCGSNSVAQKDYAALKVKLEIAQQLKVAIEDDANRTEAALKARVEELTLKGKEREQIAVDDAELIQTLRAQLEAAKLRLGYYAEGHDLTAQPSMKSIEEIVAQSVKDGENEYISVPARWLHKKLTAQPDGVRTSLWEQLAECRGRIMDKQSADFTCCFDQPDCKDHAEEKRLLQALAATAPAPVKHYINGPFAAGTPAPAYDPKPDWRCKACEETGMRHCSEPERCGNMKPPAPAKERCALCGISRENHDVIINGQPHPYAPACKTCGGSKVIEAEPGECEDPECNGSGWRVSRDMFETGKGPCRDSAGFHKPKPCPDCAKGGEAVREVAVLFARADSIYKTLPGCDVYDMERDARTFQGGMPIVGHPPCRAWGALSHMKRVKPRPDEKALAPWAVQRIRENGGVLEHPKGSKLWKHMGLPEPGALPDEFGGFTLLVDQYDWGHLAHKATRLYIVGLTPDQVPPLPPKNTAPTKWSIAGASPNGGVKGTHRITDAQREHTPPALAEWLVELARRTRTAKETRNAD